MERIACEPDALETIRIVRDEVLTSKERWTKGVFARNGVTGESVEVSQVPSLEGYQFCLLGACKYAAKIRNGRNKGKGFVSSWPAEDCLTANVRSQVIGRPFISVPTFNDTEATFEQVRAFLDFVLGEEKEKA